MLLIFLEDEFQENSYLKIWQEQQQPLEAAAGLAILPGVGTVIGGLADSLVAGAAAGKATNAVVDAFVEDDADEMVEIIQDVFNYMASEYLLSNKEAENL